jgi:hypothetical protein
MQSLHEQQHWLQLHQLDYEKIPVHSSHRMISIRQICAPGSNLHRQREQNLHRKYRAQLKGINTFSLIMVAFGDDKGRNHIQTLPCQIIENNYQALEF